jgi:4-oxalocrotonate tautomerase
MRFGRTDEQKRNLAAGLLRVVSEATGATRDDIFLVIREERGINFVEHGEHLPEYVEGAANDKELISRLKWLERLENDWRRTVMPFIECHIKEGLSHERREKLMRDIIQVTHESIGSDPKIINVIIHEHPAGNISVSSRINGEDYIKNVESEATT